MDNQQNEVTQVNEVQVSEEQLRRTYKGVEFRTEEEKNQIVALEKEAEEYCEHLDDRTYKELFEKNQQWKNLPNAIFMPYIIKLMSKIGEKEKQEIEAYKAKILVTELSELAALKNEIEQQNYSTHMLSQVNSTISERRRACQVAVLEDMLSNYTSLTRNDLKNLKISIEEKNFETDITNVYVSKINYQYDVVEQEELKNLCSGIDNMGINELEGALRIIENGNYQEKFSAQYVLLSIIRSRNFSTRN